MQYMQCSLPQKRNRLSSFIIFWGNTCIRVHILFSIQILFYKGCKGCGDRGSLGRTLRVLQSFFGLLPVRRPLPNRKGNKNKKKALLARVTSSFNCYARGTYNIKPRRPSFQWPLSFSVTISKAYIGFKIIVEVGFDFLYHHFFVCF